MFSLKNIWKRLWGFIKELIIPVAGDITVAALARKWVEHRKEQQRIIGDKRAEMLREFRVMNNNGIDTGNLERRHKECGKKDYWFVEQIAKMWDLGPGDPPKPDVSPGEKGKPQDERQADLVWLNNMDDPRFWDKMEWLYHSFVMNLIEDVSEPFKIACKHLGTFGEWLLNFAEMLAKIFGAPFSWMNRHKKLTTILFILLSPFVFAGIVLMLLFAIIFMIAVNVFAELRSSEPAEQSNEADQRKNVGLISIIVVALGVIGLSWAYFHLVPIRADWGLFEIDLVLIVTMLCLWKVRLVRWILVTFILIFSTYVFFAGGRSVAWAKTKIHVAETGNWISNTGKVAALKARLAAKDAEIAVIKKVSEHNPPPQSQPAPSGTTSSGNAAGSTNTTQSPTTTVPEETSGIFGSQQSPGTCKPTGWYAPVGGDVGQYTVRISDACYLGAGKISFEISVLPPLDEPPGDTLYLDDTGGQDSKGAFRVGPAGVTTNFIHCKGVGYPCPLSADTPTFIAVQVDRPAGATDMAFSFIMAINGGEWMTPYQFIHIPVSAR